MFRSAFLRNVVITICFVFVFFILYRKVVIRENLTVDIRIREPEPEKVSNKKEESPFVGASEAYDLASVNTGWAYPPFT